MASVFSPGTPVGRFRIEAEIGRGGMGVVYRALDLALNRLVALKTLPLFLSGEPDVRARFHREAAAVARLKHPHIAIVYEFGEHAGQPYIAFEWIEGHTLKERLTAEGCLPLERALKIFDQVADALHYAHERGVVHRDIKPANIMIGADDHLTVVDFGLAWLADAPSVTISGNLIGTPRYLAPEQIRGGPIDRRADLYSLAIVCYEMLAGQPPFGDQLTQAVLHNHLYNPPAPISEVNPTLPAALDAVLQKALAKNPDERFATASEFSGALHAAIAPSPVAATAPPSARKPLSRRWLVLVAAVMLIACALLGTAYMTQPFATTPVVLPTAPATATVVASVASPTAMPTTIITRTPPVDGGLWPMSDGDAAHSGFVPEKLGRLDPTPRWRYDPQSKGGSGLLVGNGLVVFAVDGGVVRALDWSSGELIWQTPLGAHVIGAPAMRVADDEAQVFFATDDRELHALNLADGKLAWRKTGDVLQGKILGGVTLDSSGTVYAASDGGWLHAFNPSTGDVYWSLDLSQTDHFAQRPAITGAGIFLAGTNQTAYAIVPSTLELAWSANVSGTPTTPASVAEGLGLVFVGTDQGWVYAFSLILGREVWKARASGAIVALSHDNGSLYVASADGKLYGWNGWNGEERWVMPVGSALSAGPLNDGKYVVIATPTGEVRYVEAQKGQEAKDFQLKLDSSKSFTPALAGGWLFARAGRIYAFGP